MAVVTGETVDLALYRDMLTTAPRLRLGSVANPQMGGPKDAPQEAAEVDAAYERIRQATVGSGAEFKHSGAAGKGMLVIIEDGVEPGEKFLVCVPVIV